ncbi:hypothetical protein [uncultured Paraglaciecola sp.]|uniref:hypothetical protein n=1 Tax=uncultured Paraglaciecola sp. TaxID=1765024 RepID=UPI00262F06BA|nr:hypothetical protein [uncultured Paraglaciecola sp.]
MSITDTLHQIAAMDAIRSSDGIKTYSICYDATFAFDSVTIINEIEKRGLKRAKEYVNYTHKRAAEKLAEHLGMQEQAA